VFYSIDDNGNILNVSFDFGKMEGDDGKEICVHPRLTFSLSEGDNRSQKIKFEMGYQNAMVFVDGFNKFKTDKAPFTITRNNSQQSKSVTVSLVPYNDQKYVKINGKDRFNEGWCVIEPHMFSILISIIKNFCDSYYNVSTNTASFFTFEFLRDKNAELMDKISDLESVLKNLNLSGGYQKPLVKDLPDAVYDIPQTSTTDNNPGITDTQKDFKSFIINNLDSVSSPILDEFKSEFKPVHNRPESFLSACLKNDISNIKSWTTAALNCADDDLCAFMFNGIALSEKERTNLIGDKGSNIFKIILDSAKSSVLAYTINRNSKEYDEDNPIFKYMKIKPQDVNLYNYTLEIIVVIVAMNIFYRRGISGRDVSVNIKEDYKKAYYLLKVLTGHLVNSLDFSFISVIEEDMKNVIRNIINSGMLKTLSGEYESLTVGNTLNYSFDSMYNLCIKYISILNQELPQKLDGMKNYELLVKKYIETGNPIGNSDFINSQTKTPAIEEDIFSHGSPASELEVDPIFA
jgi:hypothetical protein